MGYITARADRFGTPVRYKEGPNSTQPHDDLALFSLSSCAPQGTTIFVQFYDDLALVSLFFRLHCMVKSEFYADLILCTSYIQLVNEDLTWFGNGTEISNFKAQLRAQSPRL